MKDKINNNLDLISLPQVRKILKSYPNLEKIIVGVVDNGGVLSNDFNGVIMSRHPRLQLNKDGNPKFIRFQRISTGVEDNNFIPFQDEYVHGTNVASVIGANDYLDEDNPQGKYYNIIGVNPEAQLISLDISVKISGEKGFIRTNNDDEILKRYFSWIAGIPIADEKYTINNVEYSYPSLLNESEHIIGADIINCSWGILDTSVNVVEAIDTITCYGRKGLGTIACFAAGNENKSLMDIAQTPKGIFARHKKTITVAAVTRDFYFNNGEWTRWRDLKKNSNGIEENKEQGSNYDCIDVCAPCGFSLDEDDVHNTYCVALSYHIENKNNGIFQNAIMECWSGTSAATPIVSGIISFILSIKPTLNWLEVRDIVRKSVLKVDENSIDEINKWYKLSTKENYSRAYGYGLINALIAIQRTQRYNTRYDLWIKRSGTDDGNCVLEPSEVNVPSDNLKCSPHSIKTKLQNIGGADSIAGAEVRYLIGFSDLLLPSFVFPNSWMDNQIDSFLIGNSEIGVIPNGETMEIKQEDVTQTIGEKKIGIEKVLRKCPADKHPYLLVHITPFDYGVTGNSVRTNNNLAYKRDVFLNAEFLQGDGTTRLPNSLPKSETPVPFKINVKMYNKVGSIDLNGMELNINGFVKKNQDNPTTVFSKKYDGESSWTGAEQNNIVTDISTEVVDRNAQDEVTEVVISGNILICELYKKLQITVSVPNCLNECTHEIRRKSAIFSKFTSALVEDMEFREKIYFFTDCDNLSNTKKYGAISSGDTDFQTGFDKYRITNVFAVEGTQETNTGTGTETTNETNSETSTPHKAYAVCKGKILVQEDKDDASLVNIVLKPEMHSSNNPAVKYFVYRGILKSSLYEDDNVVKNNGNSVVSWIEKNIEEPDKRILGVELTDDVMYSNTAPIDNAFYNPKGGFELLTVPAGWCIGTFADNYIGFEIWLDTIGFNPTFSMIRNHETIIAVEQLPMNPTDGDISAHKAQKEQILNYMDPAAYFGNLYDDRIFVRNTNSEASRDGIEYSFEKVKKENLYTQIIDNFLNKNVVYIDIRNEFNTSYNYFGNYGNVLLKVLNNKNQPTPDDCYNCYGNSDWPIIATIFTPSFDDGVVKIAFKKGDNETPLAYAAIGERGRTIAEKIAQGKTNFVDLTAENGDYTDNSVAMIVPFRTNTAPNMENTYISVASYMRIDYLRRMKPTTPNNQEPQEPQEPQEQQEPQTPENTENLPVWKQRESSADLLFRPMDMKLPIENVTEGFVVKVYEDEVYIDVPEHQIDYMARMGIARDPDNTYLFAVKSDLHTKNAFQMSNPRFSICSGVNKITKEQFMKYVFGGNYTKKEVQFKDGTAYIVSYQSPILNDFMSNSNEIDMNREAELLVISNENYNKLLERIRNAAFGENSIVYISLKKNECENYNEYTLSLQEVRPSGIEEPSEPLLAIEIMKVLGDKA